MDTKKNDFIHGKNKPNTTGEKSYTKYTENKIRASRKFEEKNGKNSKCALLNSTECRAPEE